MIITIIIGCVTSICAILTVIHESYFSWKTANSYYFKNAREAFAEVEGHLLLKEQLRYAHITSDYPDKDEIEFFKNELDDSPIKIMEYTKHKGFICLKKSDRKLIFKCSNLLYWLRILLGVIAVIYGLVAVSYSFQIEYDRYHHIMPIPLEFFINILAAFFIFCVCCLSGSFFTKTLIYWKNIDAAIKDENTAPLTMSTILKKILYKLKPLFLTLQISSKKKKAWLRLSR